MADLTNPRLIYAKGFLFLLGGVLASILLLLEQPTLKVGFLLVIAVWCFARFYYFVFYVIEHYVDPGYRFAGLWAFVRYLLQRPQRPPDQAVTSEASKPTEPASPTNPDAAPP